jgi:hypothetical protein
MTRLIRASEVGEYVYCGRAWWLHRVEGLTPAQAARLAHGTAQHRHHGGRVALSSVLLVAGLVALVLGLLAG